MKACHGCGHEINSNHEFCPRCGVPYSVNNQWQETEKNEEDIKVFSKGDLIDGTYEVLEHLGVGGMGVVYLVNNNKRYSPRKEALKNIKPSLLSSEEARILFEEEVDKCHQLKSDYVVTVFNYGWLTDDTPYFTMEYNNIASRLTIITNRIGNGSQGWVLYK